MTPTATETPTPTPPLYKGLVWCGVSITPVESLNGVLMVFLMVFRGVLKRISKVTVNHNRIMRLMELWKDTPSLASTAAGGCVRTLLRKKFLLCEPYLVVYV